MGKSFFGTPDLRISSKKAEPGGAVSGSPLKGSDQSFCHSGEYKAPNMGQGKYTDLGNGSVESTSFGSGKKGAY